MSLSSFLQNEGYQRVALNRTVLGHFEASGTLSGHPVRVLIDTGASNTVVNLPTAREFGLELGPPGSTGGGAGGSHLRVYEIHRGELRVDDALVHPKVLYAMDLEHCNAALAQKGGSPVQVILGVDVYDAHRAVIDYASMSLFLRDTGPNRAV